MRALITLLLFSTTCIAGITVYPVNVNLAPGDALNIDVNGGTGSFSTGFLPSADFNISNFSDFLPPAFGVSVMSGTQFLGVSGGVSKLSPGYDLTTAVGSNSFDYFRANGQGYNGWSDSPVPDVGALGFRFVSGASFEYGWVWIEISATNNIYVHAFAVNNTAGQSTIVAAIPETSTSALLAGLGSLFIVTLLRRRSISLN